MFDRLRVGLAHVTASPSNLLALELRQLFVEELVDRLAALSLAHPKNAGTIEVIDDCAELPTFEVRRSHRRPG